VHGRHGGRKSRFATNQEKNKEGRASYHLSAQPVKRSEGRSVVAMAAYRAGVTLKDHRRGTVVDYRKRRGVVHEEIVVPDGCADWLADRETLWNHVEAIEQRRDAQLAREINMALPHELSDDERLALVRAFVHEEELVSLGMVVDFAIHAPVPEKGDDPRNFHAHLLLTLRQAPQSGLRPVKTRAWNSDSMLLKWRESWAKRQNEALRVRGHAARVDHRSLATQRASALSSGDRVRAVAFDRVPEIHVGPKVKKAAGENPPVSKDRAAGPVRRRAANQKDRRTVFYTHIDHGSRAQFNVARVRLNAHRFGSAAAKAQTHIARLRERQVYMPCAISCTTMSSSIWRMTMRCSRFIVDDPPPSLHNHYSRFLATTEQSAPLRRIGTFGLAVGAAWAFSLGIAG
jgi:hypothetical protein